MLFIFHSITIIAWTFYPLLTWPNLFKAQTDTERWPHWKFIQLYANVNIITEEGISDNVQINTLFNKIFEDHWKYPNQMGLSIVGMILSGCSVWK